MGQWEIADDVFVVDNRAISGRTVGCRETTREHPGRPQRSPAIIGPDTNTLNLITIAALRTNAAVVTGLLGEVAMEMMLDSGSAVSLVRKDMMSPRMINVAQIPLPAVKLVTAAGDDLLRWLETIHVWLHHKN